MFRTEPARRIEVKKLGWKPELFREPLGYSVDARLVPQRGGYSVYVPQLPGVVSQGDDAETALKNITEAFRAAVQAYRQEGMPIPWTKADPPQPDERDFRIAVNV